MPAFENSMMSCLPIGKRDTDEVIGLLEIHGDDAALDMRPENAASAVFLTVPVRSRHEHEMIFVEFLHG